eukprot:g3079.t1
MHQCRQLLQIDEFTKLKKFPRTKHIFDASSPGSEVSAVTRDDLLATSDEAASILNGTTLVSVTEKVDGANIGISISIDGAIICQNRSHYISCGEHPQFSQLQAWISLHESVLRRVIEPGRHILYGEWLVAKHSLHYDGLPSKAIFFDLYDRDFDEYYSMKRLEQIFATANRESAEADQDLHPLYTVPILARRTFSSRKELLPYLERKSAFRKRQGKLEGVVLKCEDDFRVNYRCKLVRPDFQCIKTHWSKQTYVKNIVDHSSKYPY